MATNVRDAPPKLPAVVAWDSLREGFIAIAFPTGTLVRQET